MLGSTNVKGFLGRQQRLSASEEAFFSIRCFIVIYNFMQKKSEIHQCVVTPLLSEKQFVV
jgi:hypothetical protein